MLSGLHELANAVRCSISEILDLKFEISNDFGTNTRPSSSVARTLASLAVRATKRLHAQTAKSPLPKEFFLKI